MTKVVIRETNFLSYSSLVRALKEAGCEKVFVKPLSANQDNDKNQVYLGTDDSLLSVFPGDMTYSAVSQSVAKRHSAPGVGKLILSLNFSWLWADGSITRAPHGKVIYYFQYPELRFSGFLRGAARGPRALRREEQDHYGRRFLVLGIKGDEMLGVVVTDADGSALVSKLAVLQDVPGQTLLKVLPLPSSLKSTNLPLLLSELRGIARTPQPAQFLGKGMSVPVLKQATQASGWTLEALLGLPHNSKKGPDKHGYELKVLGGGALSLITTEPDFGPRHDLKLSDFLGTYGWAGAKSDGSLRFHGEHNTLRPYRKSDAVVVIEHWDAVLNAPDGTGSPEVHLIDRKNGELLAGWSLDHLNKRWGDKHDGCVFVEYQRLPPRGGLATHYVFGELAYCGLGTSVNHLLRALSDSIVYFDPGDRVLKDGSEKSRWQWRIKAKGGVPVHRRLPVLYKEWHAHRI